MRYSYLILLLCLPSCRPAPPAPKVEPIDTLLVLMRDMLEVMHDVARRKWLDKTSIEDKAREEILLADVAERGQALKLNPPRTRDFFRAQIEAAKLVQRADLGQWEAEHRPPDADAPDLAGELRPKIDALNRNLLASLARVVPPMPSDATIRRHGDEILSGFGAEVRAAAIRPPMKAAQAVPAP